MSAKLYKDLKIIIRGFFTIKKLRPWFLTLTLLNGVFSSLIPFVNIFMSGMILNALVTKQKLRALIMLVLITVAANLITYLFKSVLEHEINIKMTIFWKLYDATINKKIQSMDYQDVENPIIHNMRQRINDYQNWGGAGLTTLADNLQTLINGFFSVIFSVLIVFTAFTAYKNGYGGNWAFVNTRYFAALVFALIIANTIFSMYISSKSTKAGFEISKSFMQVNRQFNYYGQLIYNYKYGKDMRLYSQKELIMKEGFDVLNGTCIEAFSKMHDTFAKYSNIREIFSTVVGIVIYIFVALRALFGLFSIGSIVQYVGSIQQFISGFTDFMTTLTTMRNSSEALKLYFDFMDLPNTMYHGTIPIEKRRDNEYEIEFHNVSFKYPGTDIYALKNLNLKLNIGRRLAVVGMNGSGKTTMIKLLCRLYDPTEGEITLNGIDIKKYDYDEYLSIFSVVFQDFQLFSFSLGQNIATNVRFDSKKALDALDKAGLTDRLASMPKGLETPLYKNFEEDGVEISGGEAQKIALARALYKDAPFIVLDEPTAALDPVAEYEIYSKFNEIVGGKTAIFISHRLSSCRFCDDIAVFHEGRLIQRGSHGKLLQDEKGKYYELWNAQAQYYTEKSETGKKAAGIV